MTKLVCLDCEKEWLLDQTIKDFPSEAYNHFTGEGAMHESTVED